VKKDKRYSSKIDLILLLVPFLSIAQIPSGYYNTAEHLWGNQIGVEWNSSLLNLFDNTLSNIIVYPSVVSDVLFITNVKNSIIDIDVYNILGEKVISTKNTNKVDVKELSNGVYIINITDGVRQANRKFIKK
jgi:hypothetical protein